MPLPRRARILGLTIASHARQRRGILESLLVGNFSRTIYCGVTERTKVTLAVSSKELSQRVSVCERQTGDV